MPLHLARKRGNPRGIVLQVAFVRKSWNSYLSNPPLRRGLAVPPILIFLKNDYFSVKSVPFLLKRHLMGK
ncbi:MAG TPA: hypothetical protein V6D50_20720 [Chroococcales cyanobacterium]